MKRGVEVSEFSKIAMFADLLIEHYDAQGNEGQHNNPIFIKLEEHLRKKEFQLSLQQCGILGTIIGVDRIRNEQK